MRYIQKPEWVRELERTLTQISRTGFWGTCADCPGGADVRPDLCVHRDRYDHRLTPQSALEGALRACSRQKDTL